ncbi:hypothetical protein AAB992_01245 [Burkholderia contaminans]|uniref:hypothetical protein n=1 Tax=Burkholderia contaminans TaxID=488447 RepID=UPI0024167EE7|nr:hypothetical protein [Burkholderia contaminans]WFN14918.1 hypothetical protein LXE92_32345 [Burkholderia contaminans]
MRQWIDSRYVPIFLWTACASCVLLMVVTPGLFPISVHSGPPAAIPSLRPPDELNPGVLQHKLTEVEAILASTPEGAVAVPEPPLVQSDPLPKAEPIDLSVSAIVWTRGHASAIVNGKLVHQGDHLDANSVIAQIEPGQVKVDRSGTIVKLIVRDAAQTRLFPEQQVKER